MNWKELKKRLSWWHVRDNFKSALKPHLKYAHHIVEEKKLKREINDADKC